MSFHRRSLATLTMLTCAASTVADGDPIRGEHVYDRCIACHSISVNRTGPHHCNLVGRKAGAVANYGYSKAMLTSGIVWNEDTLDRFLADPMKVVPGTTMTYAGVRNKQDRQDIIAYLSRWSGNKGDQCHDSN